MKMQVPSFAMPDIDDNSYPTVHTLLYCKADVDATMEMYKRRQFIDWVDSKYEQATHYDQNRRIPVFRHHIFNITGHDMLDIKYKEQLSKTPIQIHIYYNEQKVVIINTRNGRCGISKCHTNDNFSIRVGVALAWTRYTKEEIPDYVLKCLEER